MARSLSTDYVGDKDADKLPNVVNEMEPIHVYLIVAGGIIALRLIPRSQRYLVLSTKRLRRINSRFFLHYPTVKGCRSPCSLGEAFIAFVYFAINALLMWYPEGSIIAAKRNSGKLAVANMAFLFASSSISLLADILKISLYFSRRLHCVIGWMTYLHIGVHVALTLKSDSISLEDPGTLAGTISAASVLAVMILSLPVIRRFTYPIFFLSHYMFSISIVTALLLHIPKDASKSRYMTFAFLGVFGLNVLFELVRLVYHNLSWNGQRTKFNLESRKDGSLEVEIVPTRPLRVLPGQYINIWAPSLNPWSWFQGSSFMVTSWSADDQKNVKFLIRAPQRRLGFSSLLFWRVKQNYYRYLLLFAGPYGSSEPVSRYETVLLVASDSGIFAIRPYVEHLFHSVKRRTSKTRRLRLVWQLSSTSVVLGKWVNELLYKDKADKTQMLQITIFDPMGLCKMSSDQKTGRGQVLRRSAAFEKILEEEVDGHRTRLSNDVRDESGEMLVMVSASNVTRDRLRQTVKYYLEWTDFVELDYQPESK